MVTTVDEFYVGDVGAILLFTVQEYNAAGELVAVDLSQATTMEVKIRRPDGTSFTLTAEYATASEGGDGTGSDGKMKATTTDTTQFSQAGDYVAQPYLVLPNPAWDGHAQKVYFPVDSVL